MINYLFSLYRRSPFWLRNIIASSTWPLKILMLPRRDIYIGGYYMVLDYRDNASFKYFVDRDKYELTEITAFLKAILYNKDAYVIDIGANYGAFCLAAASLGRLGLFRKIIAFEPDLRPHNALKKSISKNHFFDIDLHNLIVSDSSTTEKIFINSRSSADNRTHRVTTAPIKVNNSYEVRSTTLDKFLLLAGIDSKSRFIIKMDIQGNEPRALRGMMSTLLSAEGFILFFEHCPYLIESAGIIEENYIDDLKFLNADFIYEVRSGSIVSLSSFSLLLTRFQELTSKVETKMQGSGSNFILVKNMSFPVD